jgi:hypothetical protein
MIKFLRPFNLLISPAAVLPEQRPKAAKNAYPEEVSADDGGGCGGYGLKGRPNLWQ